LNYYQKLVIQPQRDPLTYKTQNRTNRFTKTSGFNYGFSNTSVLLTFAYRFNKG